MGLGGGVTVMGLGVTGVGYLGRATATPPVVANVVDARGSQALWRYANVLFFEFELELGSSSVCGCVPWVGVSRGKERKKGEREGSRGRLKGRRHQYEQKGLGYGVWGLGFGVWGLG